MQGGKRARKRRRFNRRERARNRRVPYTSRPNCMVHGILDGACLQRTYYLHRLRLYKLEWEPGA